MKMMIKVYFRDEFYLPFLRDLCADSLYRTCYLIKFAAHLQFKVCESRFELICHRNISRKAAKNTEEILSDPGVLVGGNKTTSRRATKNTEEILSDPGVLVGSNKTNFPRSHKVH